MKTFKHSGNTGDILYSLYCINEPSILYLHLNQKGYYGANVHPLGDVMLNQAMFDMLRPLLLYHPYIKDVKVYNGEPIDYDLDQFRHDNIDLGRGSITNWYFETFPELTADTSQQLYANQPNIENHSDYIVVNRTFRYRNADVRYKCLNELDKGIIFVGMDDEFEDFKLRVPKAVRAIITDLYQAWQLIKDAKFFIGNQSMMFAIAELMKKPRILEVYKNAPNVIPSGGVFYQVNNEQKLKQSIELILPQ